jgi:hypothetical protein
MRVHTSHSAHPETITRFPASFASSRVAGRQYDRAAMRYEELLAFARRNEGRTLETVTGRRFRLGSYLDSIVFVPESTGLGRTEGRRSAERFVARYNETGSLRPGDYAGISRDASYLVSLIAAAADGRRT